MSRVKVENRLPQQYNAATLTKLLREITDQLNLLSEGYLQAATNAATSIPTTGSYQRGDFVRNSTPSEAGGAGSKYVLLGWLNVTSGSPGTFKEVRGLTGN